jgi:two-component sensor histidine kinase
LAWSVTHTDQGYVLMFDWKESGGPSPNKQRPGGFGTRMISMVIERQLNGQVAQTYAEEGLQTRLIVPLTRARWPIHPLSTIPEFP